GRDRSAGPRSVVSNDLRSAHFAHRRASRRGCQLYTWYSDRRDCRLLRRVERHPDPTWDRGPPNVFAPAAVDGAIGNPAGELEPDPRLYWHYPDPRHVWMEPTPACPSVESCRAWA